MRRVFGFIAGAVLVATVATPVVPASASMSRSSDRASVTDPSQPGRFGVDELDYKGGRVVLQDQYGMPVIEELKGSIHLPDTNAGPWPLIVFVHGRHATCRVADRVELIFATSPCPELNPVLSDVTSYRGYDYLAHNLASHGYVVVSVSANGINSYDFPVSLMDSGMEWRAQLVGETLDLMARWNEERGPREIDDRLIGTMDFKRIGLMGHSRGGEGVARFVLSNKTRTTGPTYQGLRAVFALAPTDFYEEKVPGVHFGTIVPLCDGDVYNLQGAWMFEENRLSNRGRFDRVQFAVEGANHNFFNTVWTFDDGVYGGADTGNNSACNPKTDGNVRLTAAEQRRIGLDLMAAFFRRYLGNETEMHPLMNGATRLPDDHCPRSCDKVVLTSYVGRGARLVLNASNPATKLTSKGSLDVTPCTPQRRSGRGCPSIPNRSPSPQLTVSWDGPGTIRLPLRDFDARPYRALTFRTAVNFQDKRNPKFQSQALSVRLVDDEGPSVDVPAHRYSAALLPPAGLKHQQMLLNGIRISLSEFVGVNLGALDRIELLFGDKIKTGSIQLSDVAFQDPR